MSDDGPASARDLYFAYDGLSFQMWHDGVIDEYRSHEVSAEQEQRWLAELTELRLSQLGEAPNFRVLRFLLDHRDVRHLERLIDARPLGEFGLRCAFLEALLRYVDLCAPSYPPEVIERAIRSVRTEAERLVRAARSDPARERAARIATGATERVVRGRAR